MTNPSDLIVNAKDGYELSLAMLVLFVSTIAWGAKVFLTRNTSFIETINSINTLHITQTESLHTDYNNRIERLIESHRTDTINVLNQFAKSIQELHLAIQERNGICPRL